MSSRASGALAGRVSIVTGGTSGIGLEVARGLAALGSTTVIVGRGEERARGIAREVSQRTGNPDVAAVAVTDLSLLSETSRLADTLAQSYPKIHVLVNNAGAYFRRREVTAEGHERTFALNVLSPFLLTSRLLLQLRAAAPSRVVSIASAAHEGRSVDFARLETPDGYGSGFPAYGASKLELILLTRELARRLTGTGVTVNTVHPGFVHSGFAKNNGGGTAAMVSFFGLLFGRSVQKGADTPIFVASDPSVATATGLYFSDRTVQAGSAQSQDMTVARQLYETCVQITGAPAIPEPGVGPSARPVT